MKKSAAAELWARIEASLAQRGMFIRDADRAELIRLVGKQRSVNLDHTPAPAPRVVENTLALPVQHVLQDRRAARHNMAGQHDRREEMLARINDDHSRLAGMLERSCSRRAGYDGDDTVSY